jgi:hypothetical protein
VSQRGVPGREADDTPDDWRLSRAEGRLFAFGHLLIAAGAASTPRRTSHVCLFYAREKCYGYAVRCKLESMEGLRYGARKACLAAEAPGKSRIRISGYTGA